MMFNNAANDLATILALAGAIPAALGFFTFTLGRPRTWWRSFTGWAVALLLFSIALLFTLILGRRLGGEYPGFVVVAVATYALLTLSLWLVFAMIVLERRRGRALAFVPLEADSASRVTPRKESTMSNNRVLANAVPTGNGTLTVADAEGKTVTVDAETGAPTAKPTGKVLAGAVTAAALVVVVAGITAITPDLLEGLGPWGGVLYAGIVALGGFLASYIKRP